MRGVVSSLAWNVVGESFLIGSLMPDGDVAALTAGADGLAASA